MTDENTNDLAAEAARVAAQQEEDAAEAQAKAEAAEAAALAEQQAAAVESQAAMEAAHRAAEQDEAEQENAERDAVSVSLAAIMAGNAGAVPLPTPVSDTVDAPRGSFGQTFWNELVSAGVSTLPFVFNPDHVIFSPGISADDRARVVAVIEAHDPTKTIPELVIVTKFDFWDRMSEQECEDAEGAIAAQSVKKRRTFETAQTLRSDNELWGLLVQLTEGLFGKDRAAEILAPSVVS